MSHPKITYADAVLAIGTLPTLAPRPCATNIRALTIDLIDKLTMVPSEQTADLGFSGLVEQDTVYPLQTNVPWGNFANPGQVPLADPLWTREEIAANVLLHAALKGCWDSESNTRQAINAALNLVTPRMFRRVPGGLVGVRTFRPTDDPKVILNHLRANYGQ